MMPFDIRSAAAAASADERRAARAVEQRVVLTGEPHTDALTAYLLPRDEVCFFIALHEWPQAHRSRVLDIYQELRAADIERWRCGAIRDEPNS